ncbi:MAG: carboxypeptidase regulatory-like domain-containing protein [Gemmatimonadota bacterium]
MRDRERMLATGVLLVGLMACGGGGEGESAGAEEGGEAASAAPAVDPAVAATIRGHIAFEGTPPAAQPIDMAEEPDCAVKYEEGPPMTEGVVVTDGRLANVFVYVKSGLSQSFAPPSEPVVIDQDGCRYHPHVLGIQAGQPLLIRNSDPLLHNINTQPTENRGFNVSQPREGMETTKKFAFPEIMVPVKCDVHGWMEAYIGVTEHPFHSVSGSNGSFTLDGLPPGDYVVEAWHELYGTLTQNVTVGAQETKEISFTFRSDMAADAVVPLGEPIDLHGVHAAAAR